MRRTYNFETEITLALMPTIITIVVLFLLEAFSKHQILFSSLASSAFLIYLDPKHPTNRVRTLVIAQVSAAIIGFLIYILMGSGYLAAAISMIIAIAVMILTRAMHPPAVSSALLFAFRYEEASTLLLFLMAVVILVLLIILQRVSLWLIRKGEKSIMGRNGQ